MKNKSSLGAYVKKLNFKAYTMIFLLIVLAVFLTILTDGLFVSVRNISMLVRQMAVTGILAIGMTLIIVHGNIDLSIGAIMLVCATIAGQVNIYQKWGAIPTVLVADCRPSSPPWERS